MSSVESDEGLQYLTSRLRRSKARSENLEYVYTNEPRDVINHLVQLKKSLNPERMLVQLTNHLGIDVEAFREGTHYTKEQPAIGRGTYGKIYRCRLIGTTRVGVSDVIAMKQIKRTDWHVTDILVPLLASYEDSQLALLTHYVVVLQDQELRIFMEMCDGKDLEQLGHTWDDPQIIVCMERLLQTVKVLHGLNIVHYDIKHNNIGLKSQDQNPESVAILDFGSAKCIGLPCLPMNCTYRFLPPEWKKLKDWIARGSNVQINADNIKCFKPCDVWQLGCLLFYLLQGRDIWEGRIDQMTRAGQDRTKEDIETNFSNSIANISNDDVMSEIKNIPTRSHRLRPLLVNLLKQLLNTDPLTRLTPEEALRHPVFKR